MFSENSGRKIIFKNAGRENSEIKNPGHKNSEVLFQMFPAYLIPSKLTNIELTN